jgi:hypothetical protein
MAGWTRCVVVEGTTERASTVASITSAGSKNFSKLPSLQGQYDLIRALLRSRRRQTEKVVEFFLEREAAEAMIGEVRKDEPVVAEELRVEAIEFG